MDGSSVLADFGNRFTAEIRLPDALEARLLCPFHYFGVTDPVSLTDECFWRNGRYVVSAVEAAYTGDDLRARQRLDVIFQSIDRYLPGQENVRAIGFCVSVRHARFMAEAFDAQGFNAAALVGDTPEDERTAIMTRFRRGDLHYVFTVDVLSEGVDVPEINLVLFLRPTESLTVFLQQLGRGLRHAPGKEIVTVLDFVGQNHRKYRIDRKYAVLLPKVRHRIDRELAEDFPHLPAGCSILLERQARESVLRQIQANLRNLQENIVESLRSFNTDHNIPLSFGNFIRTSNIEAEDILRNRTWSAWKGMAQLGPVPSDPTQGVEILQRILAHDDSRLLDEIASWAIKAARGDDCVFHSNPMRERLIHFGLFGQRASRFPNYETARAELRAMPEVLADLAEVAEYCRDEGRAWRESNIGLPCPLCLHSTYNAEEIKAAFDIADLGRPGPTGVGVLHNAETRLYIHLITFVKSDHDFEPSTRYLDYPINPTLLHWQSQSTTRIESPTGQNHIHFSARGYTILFFARMHKREPFTFLGKAKRLKSHEGERPISIVWELTEPMPAALFDQARH
jgi:hypothetical protein